MRDMVGKAVCTICLLGFVILFLRLFVWQVSEKPPIALPPFVHKTLRPTSVVDSEWLIPTVNRAPSYKPKAYLHIGLPKTGSTYIQNRLERYRFKIERREYTILRFNYTKPFIHCIHRMGSNCNGTVSADLRTVLKRCLRAKHTVISSIEDISLFESPHQVQLLADMFSDFDVQLVIYLRRGLPWILSNWQYNMAFVKARIWETIHHPIAFALRHGMVSYSIMLDLFANVFGKGHLNVISFDGVIRSGNDLFGVFLCELIHYPCDDLPKWTRTPANVRYPMDLVHLKSAVYAVTRSEQCEWLWVDEDHDAILKLRDLWLTLHATKAYRRTVHCIDLNSIQTSFDEVHSSIFVDYASRLWYFPKTLTFPDVQEPELCIANHDRFPSKVFNMLKAFVHSSSFITNSSVCTK